MRCFVISLPECVERRARIRSQFATLGMPFRFFDAIDLRSDRNRYFHHCDDDAFLRKTGRTPVTGELGCFASHLMLWRTCRVLNEPILVLEDDARFGGDVQAALSLVRHNARSLGFIRLQENSRAAGPVVASHGPFCIRYCSRYPHGSMAYVISPQVAEIFINCSSVFDAPVDIFIKRYWEHRQALYTLSPAVIYQQPECGNTIGYRHRPPPSPALAVRRYRQKAGDSVARALFNLRWQFRSVPEPPADAPRTCQNR